MDGKEQGMLGDFAQDATTDSHLRYQPVAFAGSSKPKDPLAGKRAPMFTKASSAPMFTKAGSTPSAPTFTKGENAPSTMGSMNSAMNQFMGMGGESKNEEPKASMGSMSNTMNQFMGMGGNDQPKPQPTMGGGMMNAFMNMGSQEPNQSSMPRNSWSKFEKEDSPPRPKQKPSKNVPKSAAESTYGIGAKLMSKMGYVSGRGLGADGKGILNPVEHKLRPQGLGLGGIKEKTDQAKAEARRRGDAEVLNDSDDDILFDEKQKAAAAKENVQKKIASLNKTIQDLEAEGLQVPSGFREIIDLARQGQNGGPVDIDLLTTTLNQEGLDVHQTLDKARHEINMYAKEWRALQSRKAYAEFEMNQIQKKMDGVSDEITVLEGILATAETLASDDQTVETVTTALETLQFQYMKEIKTLQLDEVAVAALTKPLVREMTNWDPLTEPTRFLDTFMRLKILLGINSAEKDQEDGTDLQDETNPDKMYSYYDQLIYHVWFPKVKSHFGEKWKYTKPAMAILLIENWAALLPKFVHDDLLEMIADSMLKPPLSHWKPASMSSRGTNSPMPHTWLFPWLPYLGTHIADLCEVMLARFGHLLRGWRVSDGAPLDGMLQWKEVVGNDNMDSMFEKNLLPRLATVLKRTIDFGLDAKRDRVNEVKEIMNWHVAFKPSAFGAFLETALFAPWAAATFAMLTGPREPDLLRVTDWYEMWHDVLPAPVREIPGVARGLHECLLLIEEAVDIPHSQRARLLAPPRPQNGAPLLSTELPSSVPPTRSATATPTPAPAAPPPKKKLPVSTSTFRDVVDDQIASLDLFLIPLRRPHATLGFPLYKITASASGTGPGLTCYFADNVLWLAKRPGEFEPVGLDELDRALSGLK